MQSKFGGERDTVGQAAAKPGEKASRVRIYIEKQELYTAAKFHPSTMRSCCENVFFLDCAIRTLRVQYHILYYSQQVEYEKSTIDILLQMERM